MWFLKKYINFLTGLSLYEIILQKKNFSGLGMLQLVLTNYCNMNCNYCYASSGSCDKKRRNMTIKTAKKTIDLFFNCFRNIQNITFFGGEPTLNLDTLNYCCDYITKKYKNKFTNFIIITNLLELSDRLLNIINTYNIKVVVSLDGDEYEHNKHRIDLNGNGTFYIINNNILKLKKYCNQPIKLESTFEFKNN